MARFPLSLFLLLLCFFAGELASATRPAASSTDFIRASCRGTTYPEVCVRYLSAYAADVRRNPRQLANAALTVSVERARAASAFVSRFASNAKSVRSAEAGAVKDCLDTMADSVDRLRQSAQEVGRLGRAGSAEYGWHMSNVQTWCSAALTDENTCLDSLSQYGSPATKAAIRQRVEEVAKVTSNALALVNRLGPKN